MATLTMIDRLQEPPAEKGVKAIKIASQAAGTPGGAWAFYLGGIGHNGGHGSTYTNEFLDVLAARGVKLLPIYVGGQHNRSEARGVKDANDAIRLTREFGNRNDMLVTDIESNSTDDPDVNVAKVKMAQAVAYVGGWTKTLHSNGFRAMAYGSFNLAVALAQHGSPPPDAVWVARFRTHKPVSGKNPHQIPGVPDGVFVSPGQRAWQYGAAFADHENGPIVPCNIEGLNVDVSVIDDAAFHPPTH